jgi:hypothetical protein
LVRTSVRATDPASFVLPLITNVTTKVSTLPVARQLTALTSERACVSVQRVSLPPTAPARFGSHDANRDRLGNGAICSTQPIATVSKVSGSMRIKLPVSRQSS